MEFPKLRMPSFSLGRGGRAVVLYGLYTLVLFVVSFVATFPHDLALRRVLAMVGLGDSNLPVSFDDVEFAWWRGYRIDGFRLNPPPGTDLVPLELAHLWIRPTLGKFVRGNFYSFTLQAELYGGSAAGEVDYTNGALAGDVAWDGLNLGAYRPLTSILEEGRIVGRVSGALSFEAPLRNPSAGQVGGDISIDSAAIKGGKIPNFTLGDFSITQAKVKFKAGQGRLDVQELNVGGDVNIQQTSGQIAIRSPMSESTVSLRTSILQTATTPDWLKTLIAAIPRPQGGKLDAPLNVSGTLSKPRVR